MTHATTRNSRGQDLLQAQRFREAPVRVFDVHVLAFRQALVSTLGNRQVITFLAHAHGYVPVVGHRHGNGHRHLEDGIVAKDRLRVGRNESPTFHAPAAAARG